jgi:hypothetical protein
MLERKNGFVDLSSELFLNSPFASINSEIIAEVSNKKYVTLSGVGRIGAIKIVFPAGLHIKIVVGNVDGCLKKRLISLNNMFIYSNRFSNLKKYGIHEKEIIDSLSVIITIFSSGFKRKHTFMALYAPGESSLSKAILVSSVLIGNIFPHPTC